MTRIRISNMKCMGCVANAKQSLEGLPGLVSVEINLEQASGELEGNFDLQEAIRRLTDAGYPAELKE